MRYAFLLLFFIPLSLAECAGQLWQYVPAVVEDGSSVVNVSMVLIPGHGNAFVTTSPRIGVMTQGSIDDAVAYAHSLSDKGERCDILISFRPEPAAEYIEGPSAGTALAVMIYALLENRTIRNDTIITGTIDREGNVGPVGGLYEKAKGAASTGAKYFITPVESLYETLLLRKMEDRHGIKVLQARRVEEVIGFMLENRSIEQNAIAIEKRSIPLLPQYNSSGLESFYPVANRMVKLEEGVVDSLKGEDNESIAIKEFFSNEVKRQKAIMENGYLFSAANEAFLNYIDLSTIRVIISGDVDLPRKKGETSICLDSIKRPTITDVNFEWVVGADLRQNWAYDKLEKTKTNGNMLEEEKYVSYNELMYAQTWCNVAKELILASPSEGMAINETAWKEIAEDKLAEARKLEIRDSDLAERLDIAEKAFKNGRYGAAIYDAVYVKETVKANSKTENGDSENVIALLGENRSSLWGRIYQSHAAFLYAQNQSRGAYRTALFAKGLDEATMQMKNATQYVQNTTAIAASAEGEAEKKNAELEENNVMLLALVVAISTFLFIGLLLIMARRIYGDNSTKPRKAYRAGQKKG